MVPFRLWISLKNLASAGITLHAKQEATTHQIFMSQRRWEAWYREFHSRHTYLPNSKRNISFRSSLFIASNHLNHR